MQIAIDNAKRTFDLDLNEEIERIKKDMDIHMHGYPSFWFTLQRKNKFAKTQNISQDDVYAQRKKQIEKTNYDLVCPMNYLNELKLNRAPNKANVLSLSDFFIKHNLDLNKRKAKKIEGLIEKYGVEINPYFNTQDDYEYSEVRFEELIDDLAEITIGLKYIGLFSWLIDRAFKLTPQMKANAKTIDTHLDKNKPNLMRILYKMNPEVFLKCFK